jgi:hypothetical protein
MNWRTQLPPQLIRAIPLLLPPRLLQTMLVGLMLMITMSVALLAMIMLQSMMLLALMKMMKRLLSKMLAALQLHLIKYVQYHTLCFLSPSRDCLVLCDCVKQAPVAVKSAHQQSELQSSSSSSALATSASSIPKINEAMQASNQLLVDVADDIFEPDSEIERENKKRKLEDKSNS